MNEAPDPQTDEPEEERECWEVLMQLEDWLERPMLVMSFIWLSLGIIELVWTTSGVFELLGTIIWIVFIIEFLLRFALAPRKIKFLRRNPITIIALIAPGGEAQLVTMGSMSFPADLKIYGAQLIANRNIEFSANADGMQGAKMVAGGHISGTSNMNMGFCKNDNNFQVD